MPVEVWRGGGCGEWCLDLMPGGGGCGALPSPLHTNHHKILISLSCCIAAAHLLLSPR